MKKQVLQIVLLAFVAVVTSQPVLASWFDRISGNGNVEKVVRDINDFHSISVSNGLDLFISQGNSEGVIVEADSNLHEIIKTEVRDGVLRIYTKKQIQKAKARKIHVTVKNLERLNSSAGSDVKSVGVLQLNNFMVDVSSGADVNLEVIGNEIKGSASSGSDLILRGRANVFWANSSSGADLTAFELEANEVYAEASSGADTRVWAVKSLNASASSGGDVVFRGNPEMLDRNESSGGDVSRR